MLIDTHVHLYSEDFDADRREVIENAQKAGVEQFYLPAIDSSYHQPMFVLEADYPESVKLMMGLHPTHVKPDSYRQELRKVEELLHQRPFAAVGEIGIDLYWDKSTLGIQQEAFDMQIDLAKKYQMPIVIHARDSFDEIFEILDHKRDRNLYGIFHCFTGTIEEAKRAIELGFKLGIGGVVTFKNGKIDQYLYEINLSNIVLETDAPYLAPAPYRGKRNEPKYLVKICEKLENVYQMPSEDIQKITSENAKSVFKNY